MDWLSYSALWIFTTGVLGLILLPVTSRIFWRFCDHGYPFARIISTITISYSIYVLATPLSSYMRVFGIEKDVLPTLMSEFALPFTPAGIVLVILLIIIAQLLGAKHLYKHDVQPKALFAWYKRVLNNNLIIAEEGIFIASFLFLAYIRGQEPSVHGLEKFMDFGFINSILRSTHFPPLDMWYGPDPASPHGYPINYYYFGHLASAMLIRLNNIPSAIGYNLILASILAQGMSATFSLCLGIIGSSITPSAAKAKKYLLSRYAIVCSVLGAIVLNLGGNMHTIYLFTKGYPAESPVPFWKIMTNFNPSQYWYPNATRFIPYTIHEFPAYSYVVADLHGHVLDIPFVLLTIALLFVFFEHVWRSQHTDRFPIIHWLHVELGKIKDSVRFLIPQQHSVSRQIRQVASNLLSQTSDFKSMIYYVGIGFMLAIHYMTNAFDGPIYLLVFAAALFMLYGLSQRLFFGIFVAGTSFLISSFVFSHHFVPFATGVGINCGRLLLAPGKYGPFLVEAGNCQMSPVWMFFVLWGFFFVALVTFALAWRKQVMLKQHIAPTHRFVLTLFAVAFFFVLIPEFFYAKDIYPQHFRANTMFKLGYQAFIIMSITSAYALFTISRVKGASKYVLKLIYAIVLVFPLLFSFYSFSSYYGDLKKDPQLDGLEWLRATHPDSHEIVRYLNANIKGQPVVLEAQGDSYTDYERISANTGLPTVAGWWVHEWLWRGHADVVGKRIPDIEAIYQSKDLNQTISLLRKYRVEYVVVGELERSRYPTLNEEKFNQIGRKIFQTEDGFGALYKVEIN